MDRSHPAGMSRGPRLQQPQRFRAAHLADDDAIGPQPHGRAHQARQVGRLGGVELHNILRAALDFEGVLDDYVALVGIGARAYLVDQRSAQRGLARTGAAANHDVFATVAGLAEDSRLALRDDAAAHVVIERVKNLCWLAHRHARPPHHRRYEPFETNAIDLKLALDNWMVGVGDCAERGGHRPDETLDLAGWH